MPRWSAERRAPSVIGRGTLQVMASRCAATRHRTGASRRSAPSRRARDSLSTAPPVRRKAAGGEAASGQTGGAALADPCFLWDSAGASTELWFHLVQGHAHGEERT